MYNITIMFLVFLNFHTFLHKFPLFYCFAKIHALFFIRFWIKGWNLGKYVKIGRKTRKKIKMVLYVIWLLNTLTDTNDKVDFIAKTDKKYVSITHGCLRFITSFIFLNEGLDAMVKTMRDQDFKERRRLFGDRRDFVKLKMIHPYEDLKLLNIMTNHWQNWRKEINIQP